MKKVLMTLAAILSLSLASYSQNVTKDKQGNYIAVKTPQIEAKPIETGKTFTDNKGIVYSVYISKNGKLYVLRTSKTGNVYKMYLKLD